MSELAKNARAMADWWDDRAVALEVVHQIRSAANSNSPDKPQRLAAPKRAPTVRAVNAVPQK